ncbi:MAG: hypothetical protein CME63_14000 [Halobacteriovoraceae bacterium]|nr:hypothetical protein [Halobacteriovoraceae bacterium]|tara:strand:+ start:934 stop:2415 length:1482 start_codon:yes stop_codon:yes gene_type:complete
MKFILLLLSMGMVSPEAKILLTEELLLSESIKDTPQMDQLESTLLSTQINRSQFLEQYELNGYGGASHMQTKERPVNSFQVVSTPITQTQIGLQKKFYNGVKTSVDISTYQTSSKGNAFIPELDNATTTVVSFTAEMDIWKDLFGKLSEKQVENLKLIEDQTKLQKKINLSSYQISLRKIYWALVANNESLKIYNNLLKTADLQLKESEDRLKNRVTERDEVLRYKAQKASRESSLEFYKYQKQSLIKQLRQMIPGFNEQDLELGTYNLDNTVNEVLSCTSKIVQYSGIPYENTDYDELVGMIQGVQKNYKDINEQYDSPNVNLYGTVKSTGVGADRNGQIINGDYGKSIDDMTGHNRTGFEVGVNVSFSLGKQQKTTKDFLNQYDQKRLEATLKTTKANMVATHKELARSIKYLASVVKSEKINASNLSQRIKYMRKKYEQARATVSDLISDQDAYMNAQLSTINAQLEIVNIVLDYLTIYNDTPCDFNKKA